MNNSSKAPWGAPGDRIGNWVLTRLVSDRGMSTVWQAQHQTLPLTAAVKRPRPGALEEAELCRRFQQECSVSARMAQVCPAHVPGVYDAGVDEHGQYLVLAWLPGDTLEARLRRGRLSPRATARILVPLAAILEATHGAFIVHRDVKPGNILLVPLPDGDEAVYLFDWGVAKVLPPEGGAATTQVAGTPAYLSREVAEALPVDPRADVWSLVVVLYVALSGTLPFTGANTMEIFRALREEEAPPPSAVLPRLGLFDDFFARGLALRQEDRYETVGEVVVAFLQAMRQRRSPPPPAIIADPPPSQPPASAMRREPGGLDVEALGLQDTVCSAGNERKGGAR
jgi:eukaryotic-like serine/threonine-protein kinase